MATRNITKLGCLALFGWAAACTTRVEAQTEPVVVREAFFDPCGSTADCPAPSTCETVSVDYGTHVVTDSYCTVPCARDRDCPSDGACVDAFGSGGSLCAESCLRDSDCPTGFGCNEQFGGQRLPVCLPI